METHAKATRTATSDGLLSRSVRPHAWLERGLSKARDSRSHLPTSVAFGEEWTIGSERGGSEEGDGPDQQHQPDDPVVAHHAHFSFAGPSA
jgi:hypothetical protein